MGIQGQLTVAEAAGSDRETTTQGPTSILGRIGVLLTGALVGSNATAQPSDAAAAADDDLIEEVVVTAQRRSENLQDVPISITALTNDDIDTYRFRDPGDLAAQTPNMSVQTVQGAGTPVFSLRGVSMYDWSFADTEITGRIGLDYTTDNGTLICASFNQGYRGGAFMAQALFDPGELSAADPEYLACSTRKSRKAFWCFWADARGAIG